MIGSAPVCLCGSGIGKDVIPVISRIMGGLEMFIEPLEIDDIGHEDAQKSCLPHAMW